LATGSPEADWVDVLLRAQDPGHALILNCGNGWVERELIDRGAIKSAVAIDILPDLIEQAFASKGSRNIQYQVGNINEFDFPIREFDCVVNFAACHHVTHIDRTLRGVARSLRPDGLLVSWDYVGPHRNQYSYDVWQAVWKANIQLPPEARAQLSYPHLPTMLATDPTEAVHSELILETLHRYFESEVVRPLGGAIAYPILTHNPNVHALSESARREFLPQLLALDERESAHSAEASLFAFLLSRPYPSGRHSEAVLGKWSEEEDLREKRAQHVGGEYYDRTCLQQLTIEISMLRDQLRIPERHEA
jgi:SAM-dependent methyltransferase